MKLALTLFLSASAAITLAQPSIQNGNNLPPVCTKAAIGGSGCTYAPGDAGANEAWDVGGSIITAPWRITVVDPVTTEYASSFPNANYAYGFYASSGSPYSNGYSYFNVDADKLEVIADQIFTLGFGNDYTPNPKTLMEFPWDYGDSFTDTFQRVGSPPEIVTTTYDGYGTLKVGGISQTFDVIRIKESYSDRDDYTWYTVDPLTPLLTYNGYNCNVQLFYDIPSAISNNSLTIPAAYVYPNPAKDLVNVKLDVQKTGYKFNLYSSVGTSLLEHNLEAGENTLSTSGLLPGVYFYKISGEGKSLTGKLIIE